MAAKIFKKKVRLYGRHESISCATKKKKKEVKKRKET